MAGVWQAYAVVTGLQRQLRATEQGNSTSISRDAFISSRGCRVCVRPHLTRAETRTPKAGAQQEEQFAEPTHAQAVAKSRILLSARGCLLALTTN